jgi:cyanophycin synthetase
MNHSVISNLTDVLSRQAQESPDAVAIYLPDHSFTYKELDQLVWKGAAFLQQSGVHPRDVVALTFQSELLQVIVMLAIARIGGTVFSLSYDTPPMVRKELIQKTHTKLTLSDIANHYDDLYVDLDTLQNISFVEKQLYVESPTAPWIIVSGSGSTGKSKLIPVTHQQQIERMKVSFHGFPLGQTERFASMVHADHYSSKFLILSALRSGVAIVFFDRQHTAILELYDSMKITIFYMTVLHLQTLMEQLPPNTKERMNNLKALLIAGSSVPDLLRKQVAYSLSKQLFIGYGTNETGSTVRAVPPDSYRHKGTVGYPLPGFTVEVVDKADHLLPAETVGFIRIKSKAMIDGYIGDDEATQKAFKNGWFYPGDLGKFTKEGELIHLGRSDDMMIMNGINIYPAEIEQALTTHPDIVDVVTLPIKSHLNHHIPICAVTLSNNSNSTEEELLNYAEEHLGVRAPQKVIILDTIPRNEQGKLIRKELTAKIKSQLLGNSKGEKLNSKKKSFQLRQTLPFKLPKIVPFSEEQTDQWFREVLDITSEPLAYSMPPVSIQAYQDKLEMMWRILLLSRALLQAIRMPVFDAGTIVRIDTEDKEHDTFYLSLAKIDHVPKNIFLHALNLSTRIVINLSQNSITDESRQALFQLITNRFLTPHAKVAGSGKSTMPILEEVYKKNIPFMHLGNGVYQLGWGSRSKRITKK